MNKLKKYINRVLSIDLVLRSKFKDHSLKVALVIRNDGIGDFLLFSGFIPLYKRYFEKNSIKTIFLVKKEYENLAIIYTSKDNIISIDNNLYYNSLSYRRDFIKKIMEISPQYIISSIYRSSQCDDIARILNSKSKISIGYEGEISIKNKRKNPYDILIKSYDRTHNPNHIRYNHVIHHEYLFFSKIMERLNLAQIEKPSLRECKPFLPIISKHNLNNSLKLRNYFSYIVGAGSEKRIYPSNKLIKILTFIFKHTNLNCILLGGEKDNNLSKIIIQNTPPKYRNRLINYVGKTSLIESLSLIKNGKLTIGNETGMIHASWIMKVPTIIIYGGGHFGRFLPLTKEGIIVYKKLPCYCCNWSCKFNEIPVRCISDISEYDIIERVKEIIKT